MKWFYSFQISERIRIIEWPVEISMTIEYWIGSWKDKSLIINPTKAKKKKKNQKFVSFRKYFSAYDSTKLFNLLLETNLIFMKSVFSKLLRIEESIETCFNNCIDLEGINNNLWSIIGWFKNWSLKSSD